MNELDRMHGRVEEAQAASQKGESEWAWHGAGTLAQAILAWYGTLMCGTCTDGTAWHGK